MVDDFCARNGAARRYAFESSCQRLSRSEMEQGAIFRFQGFLFVPRPEIASQHAFTPLWGSSPRRSRAGSFKSHITALSPFSMWEASGVFPFGGNWDLEGHRL